MISIDCSELTADEQLALAEAVTEGLAGRGLALVKDESIVLDDLSGGTLGVSQVEAVVSRFVSRRKDAKDYSVERDGDRLVVRSPDPLARSRGRKMAELPDNVLKCPYCPFVTPYQELYNVHVRAHGFGVL